MVNVAHQLGASLGLAVLVSVFAAAGGGFDPRGTLAHQVAATLVVAGIMLVAACVTVIGSVCLTRVRPAPGTDRDVDCCEQQA